MSQVRILSGALFLPAETRFRREFVGCLSDDPRSEAFAGCAVLASRQPLPSARSGQPHPVTLGASIVAVSGRYSADCGAVAQTRRGVPRAECPSAGNGVTVTDKYRQTNWGLTFSVRCGSVSTRTNISASRLSGNKVSLDTVPACPHRRAVGEKVGGTEKSTSRWDGKTQSQGTRSPRGGLTPAWAHPEGGSSTSTSDQICES
jgi:hypothetical protein